MIPDPAQWEAIAIWSEQVTDALLYTELSRQFSEGRVFVNCESIPAGVDFAQELLDRVRSARVLLM